MPAISHKNNTLVYKGSSFLRQRLLLSVLSGKPVRIIDIRTSHDEPGIAEFEVNLIRLLDKVTNGTVIQLDSTGTNLYFQPGLLYGGEVDHECSLQRSIGMFNIDNLKKYSQNFILIECRILFGSISCIGYFL